MTATPGSTDRRGAPDRERRAALRVKTVLAYGKLEYSGIQQICRIREISPRGLGIESRQMPQPGQRVWIEMRGLAPSPAVVVWRNGRRGGLAFETEQDLRALFESRGEQGDRTTRSPRFSLPVSAVLVTAEAAQQLEVVDVSMGGLKLRGATGIGIGAPIVAWLDGMREVLPGQIRWKEGEMLGFRFSQAMQREDLFDLLGSRG